MELKILMFLFPLVTCRVVRDLDADGYFWPEKTEDCTGDSLKKTRFWKNDGTSNIAAELECKKYVIFDMVPSTTTTTTTTTTPPPKFWPRSPEECTEFGHMFNDIKNVSYYITGYGDSSRVNQVSLCRRAARKSPPSGFEYYSSAPMSKSVIAFLVVVGILGIIIGYFVYTKKCRQTSQQANSTHQNVRHSAQSPITAHSPSAIPSAPPEVPRGSDDPPPYHEVVR